MKREIRETRNKLRKKAIELRTLHFDPQCKNTGKIQKEQIETYKKFWFYDKLIKASEKEKASTKSVKCLTL